MATELLRRLAGPFREFGWAAGTLYVADRLLRKLSPRLGLYVYEFMVQPIGGKALLTPNLSKNLSFQEIGPGHPDIAQMPAREDIKAQRFEQGARCLGTYRKGQLIGYLWYCTHRYDEDEVRCTYELVDTERSIFDFDLYVMPQHRLGVGFLGVWHGANETLAPRGVRYTFSRLTRFNTASRRAHAHLGWKRVGQGVFLQAWGLELMAATVAPYVACTLESRVTLRLGPEALATTHPQTAGPIGLPP
jgi:hypothetical protein